MRGMMAETTGDTRGAIGTLFESLKSSGRSRHKNKGNYNNLKIVYSGLA